ncbi:hypothetical protein AVEN_148632-1 [Araneus ventricosus]|uniref:EGF-like domain-containing protein n=1 Tax=Araneus ventricosus TaxID=182803 RepID=A0A4Y2SB01_ARAVE|nr:hypothetical protein AVEN_252651-1 [Araneus ventricosus]GBN85091.1 hypothetical protein AVEN_148632-1 [Araneus ventricosus]
MNILTISFVLSACECGTDSNCTFSGLFQQKKCICKPGYWEVDGKCVACLSTCKNGNCVNEGGKDICKCNPGYFNYKETSCTACDCGPDTNCMWQPGHRKICFCKPGYAQRNDKCVACECGPDSNCTFSGLFQQKNCICKPGYRNVDGKCVVSFCSSAMMTNVDVSFALHIPMYSCLCEKNSSVKYKPVTRSDCSCVLLIVFANASRRGNCNRWKENGKSIGMGGIIGIRTCSPSNGPIKMVVSMI